MPLFLILPERQPHSVSGDREVLRAGKGRRWRRQSHHLEILVASFEGATIEEFWDYRGVELRCCRGVWTEGWENAGEVYRDQT